MTFKIPIFNWECPDIGSRMRDPVRDKKIRRRKNPLFNQLHPHCAKLDAMKLKK
jgi:hypothetical protein